MDQKRARIGDEELSAGSEIDEQSFSKYQKVAISEEEPSDALRDTCTKLKACMDIRTKWTSLHPTEHDIAPGLGEPTMSKVWPSYDPLAQVLPHDETSWTHKFLDGVAQVAGIVVPDFKEFVRDYYQV